MSKETIEQVFTVDAPARLTLSNIRGSITVRPGDDGVIKVVAVKDLSTGDPDRTEIRIRQEKDGHVVVKTVHEDRGLGRKGRSCRIDYTAHLPRACILGLYGVSSGISVQDLEGEFNCETVSGSVVLVDLDGEIRAVSVSGNISGERLSGPVRVESVSGKVCLTESNLPTVDGTTVSGALLLETGLGDGPYRFETVSGDVRLILPPEAGCTVAVQSMSGRFRTSLPITRSRRQTWKLSADLQGGGPMVRFNTVSGNLSVR